MQIDLKENEKLGNPMGVEVFVLKSCIFITFVFSFGKIHRQKHDLFENLAVTNDCDRSLWNTKKRVEIWIWIMFVSPYICYFE